MQETSIFKTPFLDHFEGEDFLDDTSRSTPGKMYARVRPIKFEKASLLHTSFHEAPIDHVKFKRDKWYDFLCGLDVEHPYYVTAYAGHQFGHFAGQLGDGRATFLGQYNGHEFQVKGLGPGAYSRHADGRAVLRSSIREYLMSEAMHFLGVPTTRALALILTGDEVVRDMFYDGHPAPEPGALVCRYAEHFFRFGHFEYLAMQDDKALMKKFIHYLWPNQDLKDVIRTLIEKSAKLVASWMGIGFVHGVLNTDNMSLAGLTLDYGPYGMMEKFDPFYTPNTTDFHGRRYCYLRQPSIFEWNLKVLGQALSLVDPSIPELMNSFEDIYEAEFIKVFKLKLGLSQEYKLTYKDVGELFQIMQEMKLDFTLFFKKIESETKLNSDEFNDISYAQESNESDLLGLNKFLTSSLFQGQETRAMNPSFVLRNYQLYLANQYYIEGEHHKAHEYINTLYTLSEKPYKKMKGYEDFYKKSPSWAFSQSGCSTLSCSS